MSIIEIYLGDGLYASIVDDMGTVKLRAPREFGDHYVVLEPEMLENLMRWHKQWQAGAVPD